MIRYAIAGHVVELPNAISGLQRIDNRAPDLGVCYADGPLDLCASVVASHDGFGDWLRVDELGDGRVVYDFDGFAAYVVDRAAKRIVIHRDPGVDDATLGHLLVDTVLPMHFAVSGELVLHASSICLGEGSDRFAVLFVGESGAGKSTTATACALAGATLLGDDFAMVKVSRADASVIPGNVGVRLWEDSALALLPGHSGRPVAQYTSKVRLGSADLQSRIHAEPVRIGVVFFLGPRLPNDVDHLVEEQSPADAFHRLRQESFGYSYVSRAEHEALMTALGSLIENAICLRLQLPESLDGVTGAASRLIDELADRVRSRG